MMKELCSKKELEVIIKNNPQLEWCKKILKNGIVIISPKTQEYLHDSEQLLGERNISKKLVVDMLLYEDSYQLLKRMYENGLKSAYVWFLEEDGGFIDQFVFTRKGLIKLLRQIDVTQVSSIRERYNEFMDFVSYDKYREKIMNNQYNIVIDNCLYKIPVMEIMNFMDLSDEKIDTIMRNEQYYNNIPIQQFLYAVSRFYKDNDILNRYEISDDVKRKLETIESSKVVDIQMTNQYTYTDDILLERIHVDEKLEKEILKDLPSDYSNLEKAIYVYIKMCKLFTYDDEYFAVNQVGELAKKHKRIENVSNISLSNNKIVCYEFNAIYSYILHKLGINYKHFVVTNKGELEFDEDMHNYSGGHSFLRFRCDKYLVKADSVTLILQGDFMQAKLNQPLVGLVCENVNEQSKEEFSKIMSKVYKDIAEKEPKMSQNEVEKKESFEDIISQFIDKTRIRPIEIKEKVDILISKINSTKMTGRIDAYSYLLQLRKILFNSQEQEENVKVSILRNSSENSARALAIISTIIPDESGKMVINRYIFKPGSELISVTRDDLQSLFDKGKMEYIKESHPKIPGIRG